eukprot:CAMPEP_0172929292 /NCGR_PEP_ID=MMETSP1075-20121228/218406_1 /TAXON_ID=2916 /ORGANISM="Ceratium fusus, Strain PA161109" /LENGTH=50 /DNA_ID=CAMNT_0013790583 /DNA_START=257 /DNA_END=409 /DNA_ORIENTATION=+
MARTAPIAMLACGHEKFATGSECSHPLQRHARNLLGSQQLGKATQPTLVA